MNRGELTSEIESILGGRSDLETRIHTWLNLTLRRITRLYPFPELRKLKTDAQTVSGQKSYDISSDLGISSLKEIWSIRLIHGATSWKLDYIPPQELDRVEARPETYSTGKPRRYTKWGNTIELIDYIPGDAYTLYIRYVKWPDEMSSDSDSPEISGVDDLLIAATCAWGYASLQENQDSDYWAKITKGLWGEILGQLQDDVDYVLRMRGYQPSSGLVPEYWNNPFVKEVN